MFVVIVRGLSTEVYGPFHTKEIAEKFRADHFPKYGSSVHVLSAPPLVMD